MTIIDSEAIFTGTQINYFNVCLTKLWLFSHFTKMEHTSNLVILGRLLQETAFKKERKEIMIDQRITIDFVKRGNKIILHEIKKSNKLEKAHIKQLLYYIYYLKHKKGIQNVEGIINYPLQRKVVKVELTPENEKELQNIFKEIERIVSLPQPPKPEKKSYCKNCSYFEFCWC